MHTSGIRRLLVFLLLISACFITTYGGRGGGGRGGSRGSSSRSRPSSTRYRPATSRPATYRPATYRPAPAPTQRPAPRPTQRPQPPSPKPPSAPDETVVAKQPASNPNFKESNPVQGSSDKQPAYNPNYKPDSNAPGGPPPPYSPGGHAAPSAPLGPPPPYQPNQPPPYGSPGQRPPYPVQPGVQPPPYPGPPGRPPAYPGLPTHPGSAPYPGSPGGYPQQPGINRPYPVQPGYPGGYPQQPGINRPYPVQPGFYQPGGNRPYPQQPLGTNVWQPQSGMPAPAYMNYGGLPTGANMYSKPHKQKGFLGSLMSFGGGKHKDKKNKYYGSYPGAIGAGALGAGALGAGALGAGAGMAAGGFLGKYGKSAAMYTILPYMAYKAIPKFRPSFGFMPLFLPMPHFHSHYGYYGHGMYPGHAHYYDIYNEDYAGRCQRPIRKENYAEMRCKSTYEDIQCGAKCEEGYAFPDNTTIQYNKCWHYTGVWRPKKNLPKCSPVCEEECLNGGNCTRPGFCSCPPEFRGDLCQFHKLNFLNCDARLLTKGEKVGWVCNHAKNETVCKIRCTEPGQFETTAAEEYKCSMDGKWTPDSIPHCIVKDKEKEAPSSSS